MAIKNIIITVIFISFIMPSYGICAAQITSGTGFFVNVQGYLITNAHVVKNCSAINIQGDTTHNQNVSLIAVNEEHDLALLKMKDRPKRIATMRYNKNLRAGDKVMTVGYPQERGVTRQHSFVTSEVISTKGPDGEPLWLQFKSSIEQGNSGGPLLDVQGNVIGVVTAKLTRYTHQGVPIMQTDLAVSMPIVKAFLDKNYIHYDQIFTVMPREDAFLVQDASEYIVNIHCLP